VPKIVRNIWTLTTGFVPLFLVPMLLFVWLAPFMVPHASAVGQLTTRSLRISSAVPSATGVGYTFTFTLESTSRVQGLKFKACTNAVGTYPGGSCTAPSGMTNPVTNDGFVNATFGSQTGWQGGTNFAVDSTGANDCTPAPNVLCANRTDTTNQTATSRTITFDTIKNPATANTAFYVGIYTYSDTSYNIGNRVDFGATASAVTQTLTTSAAVAEILQFCVGSTLIDDTTTSVATDCSALSGTSINIGTLDTSQINISPWSVDGGDNKNGVAMVRSNAGNGTVIAYDAIQQSGTQHQGTLRISGATCTAGGGVFTDPCINAAGSQAPLTPGTEEFGMTIAGINHGSTSSYTCAYGPAVSGNTCNMQPLSGYLGTGSGASNADYGTTNGFAWDESGSSVNIASSASSTVPQVDDEALILKFAATPSITTPFGTYSAKTDMIAVPTY
jgi:hypothetical protein